MFIEKIKNNGKDYLRLVHAVRKPNKNGDMVSTKKVILNIGPLDRFDDGQPDFLDRLKKSCFVDDIDGLDDSPLACAYARARGTDRMSSFGDPGGTGSEHLLLFLQELYQTAV